MMRFDVPLLVIRTSVSANDAKCNYIGATWENTAGTWKPVLKQVAVISITETPNGDFEHPLLLSPGKLPGFIYLYAMTSLSKLLVTISLNQRRCNVLRLNIKVGFLKTKLSMARPAFFR